MKKSNMGLTQNQPQTQQQKGILKKDPYGINPNGGMGNGYFQFMLDVVDWQKTISSNRPLTPPKNRYHYYLQTRKSLWHFASNDFLSPEDVFEKFKEKYNI